MRTLILDAARQFMITLRRLFYYPYTVIMLIVLFFMVIFFVTVQGPIGFSPVSDKIVAQLAAADSIRDSTVFTVANINSCTRALASQYKYIKRVKVHNMHVAKYFETYYYGFILVIVIAATLASVIAVLIVRTGWQNQSPGVKATFIGFVLVASLAGVMVKTFNNDENSKKNITRYFYYNNLQTNIYDAVAIDTALNSKCADSTLVEVFNKINVNLKENTGLFLDINVSEIPATPDIGKTIN